MFDHVDDRPPAKPHALSSENAHAGGGAAHNDRSGDSARAARSFAHLHERTIAIRLLAQGHSQILTGIGAYEADPDLGGILRVAIADQVSPYELFFIEGQWTGAIGSGEALGCDYMLSVG